jgi:small subunit ribosomal protein S13
LDKESEKNKEMPEDPVEDTTGEEKIQDKANEAVDKQNEEESSSERKKEDSTDEIQDVSEDKPEGEIFEGKTEEIKKLVKEEKPEEKKEKTKKTDKKHGDDFKYIIRLSNTDIDGEKNVFYGLTAIKGIGVRMAALITDETKIDRYMKVGNLTDDQIEKLQSAIDKISENAPSWMLNHRKDYDTGDDVHLIGPEIEMRLRDEINIMKKIRSYRGIRHERRLTVRGQRTRANNRRGLALGVSKKRD